MGLAFGLAREDLGFNRSIIDLKPVWQKLAIGGLR
jgi:heterodisulfide reductase subunit B